MLAALLKKSDEISDSGCTTDSEKQTILDALEKGMSEPIDLPDSVNQPAWKNELDDHIAKFNETHTKVLLGGKTRIMRRAFDEVNNTCYEYISPYEMKQLYTNTKIQTGVKIVSRNSVPVYSNHFEAWDQHPSSKVYTKGVLFKPRGTVPEGYFNTWQGHPIEPLENPKLLKLIHEHFEKVVCNNNRELIDYIYNWIAYTIQNPDKPAGSAIVLRGKKGVGKGIVGHFLMKIWGVHAFYISNARHLVGNFNAHLSNICFLFADEAFFSGDRQHEKILQTLITEPELTIERKGLDVTRQKNYLKILMSTNDDWAVPATEDERRYGVFDVSEKKKGNKNYFKALAKACDDKSVQAAFLYEMLHRDISNFHPGEIPESVGLKEQRMHSLKPEAKWLADCLSRGYFLDGNTIGFEQKISSVDLYDCYIVWCDRMRIDKYERKTQDAFGGFLNKFWPRITHRPSADYKHKGYQPYSGRKIPSLEQARKDFETKMKVKLDVGNVVDLASRRKKRQL
jgi:hypothetical protein